MVGMLKRARRNALDIRLVENELPIVGLDQAFDGFTLLHLSDLHADMSGPAMARVAEILPGLTYDLCVLTGDYRGKTFGPFDAAITGVARVLERVSGPVYGVLGNHDTIQMVPDLEDLGVRMLLNEAVPLRRENARLHLAGIDDAHFFRVDNIEKAAAAVPAGEPAILLSHTPEIYRQAAHAGFSVLLSGHTHGGQICLPGGYPITLDSNLPRRYGAGAWRYGAMSGYTSVGAGSSVVAVRLNCPPEITLHRLERAAAQ
jgi:predicted MPP superfamily phosphohydrolase